MKSIEPTRVRTLKDAPEQTDGHYVLYWMQSSQRADFNPALEFALDAANQRNLPLLVAFGLTDGYPEANARHYAFMLQGLAEVRRRLLARGISFVIRQGDPDAVALELSQKAALVVCDAGYLRVPRLWRRRLADGLDCKLIRVEGDVVAPIAQVSNKHEYAARTIRPRIQRIMDPYITPLQAQPVARPGDLGLPSDIDLENVAAEVSRLRLDHSCPPVVRFKGGEGEARARLASFLVRGLASYGAARGKPEAKAVSYLSPYLHFGQISPVEIALAVRDSGVGPEESRDTYLEELIVRRELAINHVWWAPDYDQYEGLPAWAKATMEAHGADPRPFLYDFEAFDQAATHDPYWNAAMTEMKVTGYMHNRLRMYWGKKILQWSATPQEAFATVLSLNNRYLLDGRDANSYANVGWIFGLHDRPWPTQPVFGTVRSMGPNTFKSFNVEAYVAQVATLVAAEG